MSRREAALEEALKLREASQAPASGAPAGKTEGEQHSLHRFVAPEKRLVDPSAVNRHVVSLAEPHSPASEQYKKIRARLLKGTAKGFLNTIMVTSPGMGEGKTVTAINLAVSMAEELDHTVLLVDADLRKPSVHEYLGFAPKCGLSEYLKGEASLSDTLIRTGVGKLVVLPAGNPPENPSELISSERMRTLVREMKLRYKDRYVIFDTSPLLVTADPLSLGSYVDGTVLLIQAARTSSKAAVQAASLLKDFNLLGVIFNNVPEHLAGDFYSYHHRYKEQGYIKNYLYGKQP